jgi:hypothetical protein
MFYCVCVVSGFSKLGFSAFFCLAIEKCGGEGIKLTVIENKFELLVVVKKIMQYN